MIEPRLTARSSGLWPAQRQRLIVTSVLALASLAALALTATRSPAGGARLALLVETALLPSIATRTPLNTSACLGDASKGYVCEPTFYIYGASKCATSSVARYLAAHPRVAFEALRAGCGPGLVTESMNNGYGQQPAEIAEARARGVYCHIVPEENRIEDTIWPPLGVPCDDTKRGGTASLFDLATCRRYFLEEHGWRQTYPGEYLVGNNKPANLYLPTGGERVQQLFPGPATAKRFLVCALHAGS